MILQYSIAGSEWIIGLALTYGLAFLLSFATYKNFESFLAYATMFSAFLVWADMLEVWVLVVHVIAIAVILYLKLSSRVS